MIFINLTKSFSENVIKNHDIPTYENSYPELFLHYYTYWSNRKPFPEFINDTWLESRIDLIQSRLQYIESKFEKAGLDISEIELVLFVGNATSNGHAMIVNGRKIVWIPIETYSTEKLIDVFISHEILHALHYSFSPEFYFNNKHEKNLISRQLITEGLATFLTHKIMPISENESYWGDYISNREIEGWKKACDESGKEIIEYILSNFNVSIENCGLFTVTDKSDIFNYRSGYYFGSQVVRSIFTENNMNCHDLLTLSKNEFIELAKLKLEQMKNIV